MPTQLIKTRDVTKPSCTCALKQYNTFCALTSNCSQSTHATKRRKQERKTANSYSHAAVHCKYVHRTMHAQQIRRKTKTAKPQNSANENSCQRAHAMLLTNNKYGNKPALRNRFAHQSVGTQFGKDSLQLPAAHPGQTMVKGI